MRNRRWIVGGSKRAPSQEIIGSSGCLIGYYRRQTTSQIGHLYIGRIRDARGRCRVATNAAAHY